MIAKSRVVIVGVSVDRNASRLNLLTDVRLTRRDRRARLSGEGETQNGNSQ
jgi:hypothetical protein